MSEKDKIKELKKFIEDRVFFESQDEETKLLEQIDKLFNLKNNTRIEQYDEIERKWILTTHNSLQEVKEWCNNNFYGLSFNMYKNHLYVLGKHTAWLFREVQE